MREIKFRAWYPGECFQDGKPRMFHEVCIGKTGKVMGLEGGWDYTGDDEKAVPMQATGLKDKNGVEIYEGDILQYDKSTFRGEVPNSNWYGVVEYLNDESGIGTVGRFAVRGLMWKPQFCEVIGNIHENPELLK